MSELPALRRLLGAYLHQDWDYEYGSMWAAVDDFAAGEPLAAELSGEIDSLLAPDHDETRLRAIVLDDMGTGYLPPNGESTIAAWLTEVAQRVRADLEAGDHE